MGLGGDALYDATATRLIASFTKESWSSGGNASVRLLRCFDCLLVNALLRVSTLRGKFTPCPTAK